MTNKSALFVLLAVGWGFGCDLKTPTQEPKPAGVEPVVTVAPVKPMLEAVYLSGGQGAFALTALKGKVVVLDFCAPWSPASQALVPELNKMQDEQGALGLAVIGMAVDAPATQGMTPELQGLQATYPLVATPRELLSRFGEVRAVPSTLIFDRKGQLRHQYPGFVSAVQLRDDVTALLKE